MGVSHACVRRPRILFEVAVVCLARSSSNAHSVLGCGAFSAAKGNGRRLAGVRWEASAMVPASRESVSSSLGWRSAGRRRARPVRQPTITPMSRAMATGKNTDSVGPDDQGQNHVATCCFAHQGVVFRLVLRWGLFNSFVPVGSIATVCATA